MDPERPDTPMPQDASDGGDDRGSLLFDETAPISFDDIDGYRGAEPESSRLGQIVIGMLVVALIVAGAFWYTASGAPSGQALSELPGAATMSGPRRPEEVVPVPSGQVEGSTGSQVRVAVQVLGTGGVPLADTLVTFTVTSGRAVIAEPDQRTDVEGIAATRVTLPREPETSMITATVPGSSIVEARIAATALPGAASRIVIQSGNQQEAPIGELLPTRVWVSVLDNDGNPVPNSEVRFDVVQGDGMAAPSQTRTDSIGRASAIWRVGVAEGPQRLTATSTDARMQITFDATAVPAEEGQIFGPRPAQPLEATTVAVTPQLFSVGSSHVCAIQGTSLNCRGGNERGQSTGTPPGDFVAVTTGSAHSCALDAEGSAQCWGDNDRGQLGNGSRNDAPRATPVSSDLRFSALTAGESHTCGLAGGGVPLCWGQNLSGQLGDGTRNDQTVPRTVGGGLTFSVIAAGWNHTCGLTASGNAFCWGLNSKGQLGDGTTLDRLEPVLVRGAVSDIVAGSEHTCGISQGGVLCWGGNDFGQLGNDSNANSGQPVQVVGLPGAPTELAAGAVHSCALVNGGQAWCWGQNYFGQLGDGSTDNHARPVAVAGNRSFVDIHAGGAQTCARTADGTEFCWGLNQNGQLGDGSRVNRTVPTRVGR